MNRFWIMGTFAFLLAGSAAADEWNKRTNLTVNEPILVPGKELMPGKYVMKLLDSSSNRHIVQIFNEDQTKLEATIMAYNKVVTQPDPKGNTILTYWETPAGSPPALRGWIYPGDTWGQEFAYPKKLADQLSTINHTKVASYDESKVTGTPNDQSLSQIEAPTTSPSASNNTASADSSRPKPNVSATAVPPPADNSANSNANVNAKPANDPTLVAQNTTPSREPTQVAQAQTTPATPSNDTLPQTSTQIPAIIAVGFLMAGLGTVLVLRSL